MKIFDIEDGKVLINENCYLINELKLLLDKYEDPIPVFTYIHFLTHPDSPYHNVPDGDKELMISNDVGGYFDLDDELIDNAINKLKDLYRTPIQEYYEGQKNAMYVMGKVLKNLTENSITLGGKESNMEGIFRMQKEAGKVMESFLKLEKLWKEQSDQKLRGNSEIGEY